MELIRRGLGIARDPGQTKWICPLLLLADAGLTALIVWKIPYTEIDWRAYMEQVAQYVAGERDYTKLYGGTGPLVYPAAHVYIYEILYHVTNEGRDILLGQIIFGLLYLSTLGVTMACYRNAKVPPYVFPMLILSKRMHSIFTLRLFNDCFAVFFLFAAIYCLQKRWWTVASAVYSIGLGVKMSLLLALPAVGIVLLQAVGRNSAIRKALVIVAIQVLIAFPFATYDAQAYLSRAFEFTRQFLFKWTVNWRFVGEQTFLSRQFSLTLLGAHASLLALFALTRWLKPSKQSLLDIIVSLLNPPSPSTQTAISKRVTPRFILTTTLTANAIGMLCARSLHYQFYSYIVWATPFLLWRAGLHPALQYASWAAQEYAWNVYPSTDFSSMIVVQVLALQVAGVWYGTRKDHLEGPSSKHRHVE
ncbi:hypothetical protein MBLNU459_g1335t1 [Dothideomycetes sp. NU459]